MLSSLSTRMLDYGQVHFLIKAFLCFQVQQMELFLLRNKLVLSCLAEWCGINSMYVFCSHTLTFTFSLFPGNLAVDFVWVRSRQTEAPQAPVVVSFQPFWILTNYSALMRSLWAFWHWAGGLWSCWVCLGCAWPSEAHSRQAEAVPPSPFSV